MADNRADDDAERQQRPHWNRTRDEQQYACDQFGNAGADATPRFQTEHREDVHRFRCSRELEEQRLPQDRGRHDL